MSSLRKQITQIILPQEYEFFMKDFIYHRLRDLDSIEAAAEHKRWEDAHWHSRVMVAIVVKYDFKELGSYILKVDQLIEKQNSSQLIRFIAFLRIYLKNLEIIYE